jgi:hypothetical protein
MLMMARRPILLVLIALVAVGCGPATLVRGDGSWRRGASVVLHHPITIVDESLDPPLEKSERDEFESAFTFTAEQRFSSPLLRECRDNRGCVHLRVTVRMRQTVTTELRTPSTPDPETIRYADADADASIADPNGRLIEVIHAGKRQRIAPGDRVSGNASSLAYELGQYVATHLR